MYTFSECFTKKFGMSVYLFIKLFVVYFSGEVVGAEEQAAVTIASVQQAAAFADHNVQYQFRTENTGGQVSATFDLFRVHIQVTV